MLKIAVLGVIASLLAIILNDRKEYSIYLSIVCIVIVGCYVLDKVQAVVEMIDKVSSLINVDVKYIKLLLKMVGITYVSDFSAQICTDAGYESISKQIEIAAKFTILVISIPIVLDVIDVVTILLK